MQKSTKEMNKQTVFFFEKYTVLLYQSQLLSLFQQMYKVSQVSHFKITKQTVSQMNHFIFVAQELW